MWKAGLKLDYTPKKINLENDKGISSKITAFGCGTKHYCLINDDNQLLVWGNMMSGKSSIDVDGFKLYDGDTLFNGGKVINLSVKYGLLGVVTDDGE